MNNDLILLPALLQVALTLGVYVALNLVKQRALARGEVDEARLALHADAWPDRVMQFNNNIRNQFELPVLFYVVALILWGLNAAGLVAQIAAWLFVLSRMLHVYVHTGRNVVAIRRRIFSFGVVMVAVMAWIAFAELIRRA